MPYDWVEPEKLFTHRGVSVYELYDEDQVQEGAMEYWFTLDSTASAHDSKNEGVFDIRDLPEVPGRLRKGYGLPGKYPHEEDEARIKWALDSGYFDKVLGGLGIELKPEGWKPRPELTREQMYEEFWKHQDLGELSGRVEHLLTIIPRSELEGILENMGVYEEQNDG